MAGGPRNVQPTFAGTAARRPRVCLYVDESMTARWTYIGVLAVADDEHVALLAALDADRAAAGYDGELHFSAISQHHKAACARRWLIRARGVTVPPVRFHILAIDTNTLNRTAFGDDGRSAQDRNVYRRFLRTALAYPVIAFWPDQRAVIQAIVHDSRTVAAEEYFGWHTPWKMRQLSGVEVATDEVQLVDSDHRISGRHRDSTFIQLIDVILGVTRVALEDTTTKRYQRELALEWLPLVHELVHPDPRRRWDNDRTSPYGQFRRCNLSFFPRYALTAKDLEDDNQRARKAFYRERVPLLIHPDAGEQGTLL